MSRLLSYVLVVSFFQASAVDLSARDRSEGSSPSELVVLAAGSQKGLLSDADLLKGMGGLRVSPSIAISRARSVSSVSMTPSPRVDLISGCVLPARVLLRADEDAIDPLALNFILSCSGDVDSGRYLNNSVRTIDDCLALLQELKVFLGELEKTVNKFDQERVIFSYDRGSASCEDLAIVKSAIALVSSLLDNKIKVCLELEEARGTCFLTQGYMFSMPRSTLEQPKTDSVKKPAHFEDEEDVFGNRWSDIGREDSSGSDDGSDSDDSDDSSDDGSDSDESSVK